MNDSMASMDEFSQLYFMPVRTATPLESTLFFKLQVPPPMRDDIYGRIKDTPTVVGDDWVTKLVDGSTHLLVEEERVVAASEEEEGAVQPPPLLRRPSQALITLMMKKVFNMGRNQETHPENRSYVLGYILQKLLRTGLMVATQDFEHEIPLGDLARLKNIPHHVVSVSTA